MRQYKIIFSGPVGAGKTTAIQSLSDIDVVATEARATDKVKDIKENTTVAMDYGRINLDAETTVHLYGTPGQQRFDFMWEILAQGALGLVLLIDCSVSSVIDDIDTYLSAFSKFAKTNAVVIGLTRSDILDSTENLIPWDAIYKKLDDDELSIPIFEVDARNKDDMNTLLEALILSIDPMV
jgi:signal recognition particle receptor subunit beta